jgi:hypothetical protein
VKWLLIVNTAIFVIWYLGGPTVQSWMSPLALVPMLVVHSFPWYLYQLFTYMFLHGGIGHLLFNMLALWMFGLPLEQTWGTRRFLKYYFLCGVGAGICDTTVNVLLGHNTSTIGASGAIYGLLLAFGVLFPDTQGVDVLPVPDQGQVSGDDLRRGGASLGIGHAEQRHQQHCAPGRNVVRPAVPEGADTGSGRCESAGFRRPLPAMENAAGQEEIPGLHAQTRRPRPVGKLSLRGGVGNASGPVPVAGFSRVDRAAGLGPASSAFHIVTSESDAYASLKRITAFVCAAALCGGCSLA